MREREKESVSVCVHGCASVCMCMCVCHLVSSSSIFGMEDVETSCASVYEYVSGKYRTVTE